MPGRRWWRRCGQENMDDSELRNRFLIGFRRTFGKFRIAGNPDSVAGIHRRIRRILRDQSSADWWQLERGNRRIAGTSMNSTFVGAIATQNHFPLGGSVFVGELRLP